MVDEESEKNGCGVLVVVSKSEVMNGFLFESENGGVGGGNSAGSSGSSLRTYKRRKHTKTSSSESKLPEDGKVSMNSASQHTDKTIKEPLAMGFNNSSCNRQVVARMDSRAFINGSDGCSLKHCRNLILENMYQSLTESEGGLQKCIRDASEFHPENGCTTALKESVNFDEKTQKFPSETESMPNGAQNAAKGHGCVVSNGSLNESNHHTNTELCKRAFFDILISENFAELCKLLFENFQGIKADSILDVSSISTRMKEGAYESLPTLFHSDIQQVWTKLQKVGTKMAALAKSLSDKSRTSCGEKFLTQAEAKPEQAESCGVYRVCTCRHCGEKSVGRDCLVCDSCEEMYHVSCIEPAVQEIPLKNWYCTTCTAKGILSPHENCVLCERLNAPTSSINGVDGILTNGSLLELVESSNGLEEDGGKDMPSCNICRNELENGEQFKICGHSFCPHKYYHVRCLTSKQLHTSGPCWYCPSCLCRVCLSDRDDDKIVLCDACDQAYHIYCMQPPRTSIPRGKWFCRKCKEEIQCISKAKKAYEIMQFKLKRRTEEKKEACGNLQIVQKDGGKEVLDKSVGVDMLLTAAKTINFEDDLAALGMKS